MTMPCHYGACRARAAATLGSAAAGQGRYFGSAVAANHLGEADCTATPDRAFTSATPENETKWEDATGPGRGTSTFGAADRVVDHARSRAGTCAATPSSGTPNCRSMVKDFKSRGVPID